MKATDLDAAFDENAADIVDHLDLESARRPKRDAQRVNVASTVKPTDDPIWPRVAMTDRQRPGSAASSWDACIPRSAHPTENPCARCGPGT